VVPLDTDPGIIKTTSVHETNTSDTITRFWAIRRIQRDSFSQARVLIDDLNQTNYKGRNDWRIPTIEDLLSIIKQDPHRNFFPSQLGLRNFFLRNQQNRNIEYLDIWSSTPLQVTDDQERRRLTDCQEDVYFIIRNTRDSTHGENNWIGFHISCENWPHLIIPVSSTDQASATASTQTPPVPSPSVEPQPSQPTRYLYVSQLPFINRQSRTSTYVNKYVFLVNDALLANVKNKIHQLGKEHRLNQRGRTIPSVFVNQIWDILKINASEDEIVKRISNEIMQDYNVDVLITGMYDDNQGDDMVLIWPKVIFRGHKRMMKGTLTLKANDLTRVNEDLDILKKDVLDQIELHFNAAFMDWPSQQDTQEEQPVPEVVEQETPRTTEGEGNEHESQVSPPSSTPALPPVYATQLHFIDKSPRPVKGNRKKELELISDFMAEEINRQLTEIQKKDWNKQLIINQLGRSVPNTTENIEKVIEITFDQFMPKENRIDKIVEKIMTPYNIDIIITGQFTYNSSNSEFIIRPIVILKSMILTENFYFDRSKLVYVSGTSHRINFRRGAKKIIEDTVKGLIEKIGKQQKK
jgi:hypothetical protein